MTLRDLLQLLGRDPLVLASALMVSPLFSWLLGRLHGPGCGGHAPWRYLYSLLVYLACVPGMFACVLTGYALFFRNENLLDVNFLVYILPILSMAASVLLIGRNVDFAFIPGFDRLSGLMIMLAASFALALAVQKTFVLIVFGSSIVTLFLVTGALFGLIRWGAHLAFRNRGATSAIPPSITRPDS